MVSVFSSAYFLTRVLPANLQFLTSTLLPHAALVRAARLSFLKIPYADLSREIQSLTASALAWAIALCGLGYFSLRHAMGTLHKQSSPLYFPE
ncbi:MAG: hypothetical protein H7333_02970 [Bdellovibrionales bacterium]|nr:hypothetical protein [Oligoflexia bacterium]